MKHSGLLILGLVFIFNAGYTVPEESGSLVIEINNITSPEGIIWVGIYDSEENFMIKENAIVEGYKVDETGHKTVHVDQLTYGKYAIALFHDINGNGELDRNWLGIPSEPYAFSRRPKSKWRLPRFREIVFSFTTNRQHLSTSLRKWSD